MNRADIRAMLARPFNAPPIKATPVGYVGRFWAKAEALDAYTCDPTEANRIAFLASLRT